jgi:2-polyprenyl-3-methyl-5-hydroxy-6-metoxy-1,4-benzoquinol methylase
MFISINIFLWHLEAFKKGEDPVPLFIDVFERATQMMQNAINSKLCVDQFPCKKSAAIEKTSFEKEVSGLFSDVWVDMTDDIYFDQTFRFTSERFEKNDINPYGFFEGKIVLDAGCGSGKFSAAIARFGASKVIGMDIGEKGLEFARTQAKKVSY